MILRGFSALAVTFLALSASPAAGQGVFDMGMLTGTLSIDHVTQSERERARKMGLQEPERARTVDVGRLTPASPRAAAALRYTPSLERRRVNLAQFVSKSRKLDPKGAAELERALAQPGAIDEIAAGMRGMGLRHDNVADAYTLWWVIAWYASQGIESVAHTPTMAAVRAQAAAAMLVTGQVQGASEAQKQEMAEALMIQAVLLDAANDKMRGNPTQLRALKAAAASGARSMGLDLSSMTLTPQGFRPRKGVDSAAGAPAPVQLASAVDPVAAAPANDAAADAPPYALIAAAGGAGLAAMFILGKVAGRRGS